MESIPMSHHHTVGFLTRGSAKASGSGSNFIQQQQQQQQQQQLQPHNQLQQSSFDVWNNFLISAGIPLGVAHDYAITFSQHRIRIDMLKEITKDILLDMGIKAMGDIIAILRHAKQICTQNELKTVVKTTNSSSNNNNLTMPGDSSAQNNQTSSKSHLSQRTPINLNQGASLVGNKIQSRLNLDSGALVASSSYSLSYATTNNIATTNNNKRPASTLSSSMAKRLRPSAESEGSKLDRGTPVEKTLTVHYPPRAAIVKAAQRISGTNISHSTKTGSIKSRLGSTASHSGRGSDTFNNARDTSRKSKPTGARGSSMTPNKHTSSLSDRKHESRQSNGRRPRTEPRPAHGSINRPKSTVFNRLGETIR